MIEPALTRFAERLRAELGADDVLLFGSRAREQARVDSDYDVIVVSNSFEGMPHAVRGRGLQDIWYQSGGHGPMDLLCLTRAELATARNQATLVAAVLPEAISLLPSKLAGSTTRL